MKRTYEPSGENNVVVNPLLDPVKAKLAHAKYQKKRNHTARAQLYYLEAIQLLLPLLTTDQDNSEVVRMLLDVLDDVKSVKTENLAKALQVFADVITRFKELVSTQHDDLQSKCVLLIVLNKIAIVYNAQKNYADAEKYYHEAIVLGRSTIHVQPDDLQVKLVLLRVLHNIVGLYTRLQKFQEIEGVAQEGISLAHEMIAAQPDQVNVKELLAGILHSMGGMYRVQKKYSDAQKCCEETLVLAKEISSAQPDDLESKYTVSQSLGNLGLTYNMQKKYADAEKFYLEAVTIAQELIAVKPDELNYKINKREGLLKLALLYAEQQRYLEAEKFYIDAIILTKEIVAEKQDDLDAKVRLMKALNGLASVLRDQAKNTEALKILGEAMSMYNGIDLSRHKVREAAISSAGILRDLGRNLHVVGMLHASKNALIKSSNLFSDIYNSGNLGSNAVGKWIDVLDLLSSDFYEQKSYKEAAQGCKKMLELFVKFPSISSSEYGKEMLKSVLSRSKNVAVYLHNAAKNAPNSREAMDKALSDFELSAGLRARIIKLDTSDQQVKEYCAETLFSIARIHIATGDMQMAFRAITNPAMEYLTNQIELANSTILNLMQVLPEKDITAGYNILSKHKVLVFGYDARYPNQLFNTKAIDILIKLLNSTNNIYRITIKHKMTPSALLYVINNKNAFRSLRLFCVDNNVIVSDPSTLQLFGDLSVPHKPASCIGMLKKFNAIASIVEGMVNYDAFDLMRKMTPSDLIKITTLADSMNVITGSMYNAGKVSSCADRILTEGLIRTIQLCCYYGEYNVGLPFEVVETILEYCDDKLKIAIGESWKKPAEEKRAITLS